MRQLRAQFTFLNALLELFQFLRRSPLRKLQLPNAVQQFLGNLNLPLFSQLIGLLENVVQLVRGPLPLFDLPLRLPRLRTWRELLLLVLQFIFLKLIRSRLPLLIDLQPPRAKVPQLLGVDIDPEPRFLFASLGLEGGFIEFLRKRFGGSQDIQVVAH